MYRQAEVCAFSSFLSCCLYLKVSFHVHVVVECLVCVLFTEMVLGLVRHVFWFAFVAFGVVVEVCFMLWLNKKLM